MFNSTRVPEAIFKASELIQCLSASMRENEYSSLWFNKARWLSDELTSIISDINFSCHQ